MSEKSADREVTVKLALSEVLERAEAMARRVAEVQRLRVKKAADAKGTQALIDSALDEIERLGRVITAQEELRKQGELFVGDQVVPQGQALSTLAKVAEAAGDTGDVDTLIDEQTELMDATDAARDEGVPVIAALPEACPLCSKPVRTLGDDGAMCTDTVCVWVAKVAPAAQEPIEEPAPPQTIEECERWCAEHGGQGEVIASAVKWWREMHPQTNLMAAMLSWRAQTGAPFAVTWALAEDISAENERLNAEAADAEGMAYKTPGVQREAPADCDHSAVPAGKKPGKAKKLVCPTCRETLANCEACDKRVTADDVGDCQWDDCGKKLCIDCLREHGAKAEAAEAALASAAVDEPEGDEAGADA